MGDIPYIAPQFDAGWYTRDATSMVHRRPASRARLLGGGEGTCHNLMRHTGEIQVS
jgi:hypothetical protein